MYVTLQIASDDNLLQSLENPSWSPGGPQTPVWEPVIYRDAIYEFTYRSVSLL